MSDFSGTSPGAKRRDYWWTVVATDPVAVPLVRALRRTGRVTPDQVTVAALIAGLAVGPIFALDTRTSVVAGGIMFYVAFVLDCVDGKLARALSVTSPRGEALDHLADAGRRASASLGLALSLWRGGADPGLPWALVYIVLAYLFLEISGAEKPAASTAAGGRWERALGRRRLLPNPGMPDVQALVFIIGPITGLVVPALGLGIAMVVAAILLTVRRRLW